MFQLSQYPVEQISQNFKKKFNGKENRDHYNFLTFFVSFIIVLQIFPVNLFQL